MDGLGDLLSLRLREHHPLVGMHSASTPFQVAGHVAQLRVDHGEAHALRSRTDGGFHLRDEQVDVCAPRLMQRRGGVVQALPRVEQGVSAQAASAGAGLAQRAGHLPFDASAGAGVASVEGARSGEAGVAASADALHFVAIGGVHHGQATEHVTRVDRVLEFAVTGFREDLPVDAAARLTASAVQVANVNLGDLAAAVAFDGDLPHERVLLVFENGPATKALTLRDKCHTGIV